LVEERGHDLVAFTRDEGISGSNGIETRLGLDDALELLRTGEAEGLVVYRLDRPARDLIVQETLLAETRRMGAVVFSTSAGESAYLEDEPHDPSRRLIRQVLGAVNEYERAMIGLRLKAGRRRKHEQGGFAFGAPPYGWKAESKSLVPIPEEQQVIERMRQLLGEGLSLRAIAPAT
jgi:DNA invertase Pin-like site-specific DNA recombinase